MSDRTSRAGQMAELRNVLLASTGNVLAMTARNECLGTPETAVERTIRVNRDHAIDSQLARARHALQGLEGIARA